MSCPIDDRRVARLTTTGAGVAAVASLLVASSAFACTEIMGSLTLTPSSGPGGTIITTSASGLKPRPAVYALHFTKGLTSSGANCMSFTGVVTIKKITPDSTGAWSNIAATIPPTATLGTHSVCGMEVSPSKGNTGTTHDTFTVT